ncbi:c-type cytochrome, partial [Sulfurovum sp.]|uniref:c-type cytochrome n=1 Tax=Sulfurovum sp. TaxID=1969726 RepID=UPI0035674753
QMYKSYHKKIVASTLLASVVFLGTACNASNGTKETAEAKTTTAAAVSLPMNTEGFTKREIDAVGPLTPTLSDSVKNTYDNGKLVIDGGVIYPIVNGKTGAYHVNEEAHKTPFNKGKTATANEQKAWDIDVMPDGTGLPEGSGTVEDGDAIYEAKCQSCHGDFGAGAGLYPRLTAGNAAKQQKTLMNQRVDPDSDGPTRVFGSNWPYASTLWWYIKTGMPHQAPLTLPDDEVYALTAYILYINEMSIDGVEVDDEYELDREKFLKIVMPNVDGFEPAIDGPNGPDNAREYFNNPLNYGNGVRCMKDCFEGEPEIQRIGFALTDFSPPLNSEKTLPEVTDAGPAHPGKANYDASCKVCHETDAMGAPAVGDKAAWTAALEKGIDQVYHNAINGINGMPPKGGAMDLTDAQMNEVVDYMLEASK